MFNEICCDCIHRQVCVYDVCKNNIKECEFKQTEQQITSKHKKSNRNWRRKNQRLKAENKLLQARSNNFYTLITRLCNDTSIPFDKLLYYVSGFECEIKEKEMNIKEKWKY